MKNLLILHNILQLPTREGKLLR